MQPGDIDKYREKMILVYKKADEVCRRHAEADRNTIVQSLLMREQSPAEKVRLALLRGSVLKKPKC